MFQFYLIISFNILHVLQIQASYPFYLLITPTFQLIMLDLIPDQDSWVLVIISAIYIDLKYKVCNWDLIILSLWKISFLINCVRFILILSITQIFITIPTNDVLSYHKALFTKLIAIHATFVFVLLIILSKCHSNTFWL